jgi:long-chain-fatty-acid--[acyl-carrier-protein] ligase
VYHPNPTESAKLSALIAAYRVGVMAGTPTFLAGILRTAREHQLDPLRLVVTGAEQCPPRVYETLSARCPRAIVLEGYGITECSPVISANRPGRQQPGTIGELMPSLQAKLVDPDSMQELGTGQRGMLLVRGPSVFSGYLCHSGESPFVELAGERWYKTGDLVTQREDGVLEFGGRLKRFVKLGGEMISLPAIEAALSPLFVADQDDERPSHAVEASSNEEHAELVLFSRIELDRELINRQLRDQGFSPLHNIRRVVLVDEIPLLGTGKVDYRQLRQRL